MKTTFAAAIFDLDGTLIDNNSYHILAWQEFYKKRGWELSHEEYKTKFNGKVNRDIFNHIFQTELTADAIKNYSDEKEALYRELYKPHIEPINGLIKILDELYDANVPMAIATSGLPVNIDFMFEHVPVKKYFKHVVDSTHIIKGKPDPEIFIKAAASVNAQPNNCVAFEDSIAGIRSAKAAGMKVVGLTTTHTREDVHEADLIIKDYTELSLEMLNALFV
jgi:beta-phosphoglucomutase family hydrolase